MNSSVRIASERGQLDLEETLEESGWSRLVNILGAELVARLLGVSIVSIQRYASGKRPTPDEVVARLHFLALVVEDLAGTYNDMGVRRWFDRARTLLRNKTPAQFMTGKWQPEDSGPRQIRQLAHTLVTPPAT